MEACLGCGTMKWSFQLHSLSQRLPVCDECEAVITMARMKIGGARKRKKSGLRYALAPFPRHDGLECYLCPPRRSPPRAIWFENNFEPAPAQCVDVYM